MSDLAEAKNRVITWLDDHGKAFFAYADAIWSYAELGCCEHRSSELLIALLEKHGFDVEAGVAGLPTAFVAKWGSGSPAVAVNCEYDALAGLSQHPLPQKKPLVAGAPGHGCGHNILGVGSIMAAVAAKEWLSKTGRSGRIVVFGAPAEEVCIGKPYMARSGLFDNVDAIIDWHPWAFNGANYDTCNAYFNIKYHFRGRTAHGNAPWEGRSALDAAMLMGHAIEMLREHIPPGHPEGANTINYTFPDVGPEYPNVVPDRSTVWVIGRITSAGEMQKIIQRVHKCAEAAGLATETNHEVEFVTATHEKIPNQALSAVLYENLKEIGAPQFDQAEQNMAKEMQRDLGVEEDGLSEELMEFRGGASAVSDNSEYSWFAPFGMLWVTAGPSGIGWHNWQVVASVEGSIGKKAMMVASKALAASVVDLMLKPQTLEEAKKECSQRLTGKTYVPLLGEETNPPVDVNLKTMEQYRNRMEKYYKNV
jgi:aminobenzoyl-glutamate utilization protein B